MLKRQLSASRLIRSWLPALVAGVLLMAMALPAMAEPAAVLPTQAEAQILIASVEVQGNVKVPAETILAATSIKPGAQFSKAVLEAKAQSDMNAIVALGTVADVKASLEQFKNGIVLIYKVQENPTLSGVEFSGNTLVPSGELTSVLGSKLGEIIDRKAVQRDIEAIAARYTKDGYNLADCSVALGENGKLVFTVLETRIEKIEITGNIKTKTDVISRELISKVGNALDTDDIKAEIRRIFNLGFFEDVAPQFAAGTKPELVTYHIEVKERKSGTYGGALTYGPDGLMGSLYITDPNFRGRGETLSLNTEAGLKKSKSLEATFREPWLAGGKTSMEINLFSKDTRLKDRDAPPPDVYYMERRTGGDITFGLPAGEDNTLSLGAGSEYTDTRKEDGSPYAVVGQGRSNYLDAGFTRDMRDNVIFANSGYKGTVSVRLAGLGFLGGDNEFTKLQGSASTYVKVWADTVLAARVAGGKAWNDGQLPTQERFRLGGSETIRGYDFGAFQGDTMVYGNLEYRIPVKKVGSFVLFADTGDAWNAADGGTFDGLNSSVGLGVRVTTPMGEIRLDWGWHKGSGGGVQSKGHFSIGQMF